MSESEKRNIRITIIVAVIGFAGTILASVLPGVLEDIKNRPNKPTATMAQPATTETPYVSASTNTPATTDFTTPFEVQTPTGVTTPITPPLICLDRWQAFSSSLKLPPAPVGSDGCAYVSDSNLGIGAGRAGLVFAVSNLKEKGIYGISTLMPRNATIRMTVKVSQIDEGEFWIAFGRDTDPRQNAMIFAIQPDTGDIHTYIEKITSASAYYLWSTMQASQPSTQAGVKAYAFVLHFDGNRVDFSVNGVSFATLASPAWENLFLGYRAEAQSLGTNINVEVTGLFVEGE